MVGVRNKLIILIGYHLLCLILIFLLTYNKAILAFTYDKLYPIYIVFWDFIHRVIRFPLMYIFVVSSVIFLILLIVNIIKRYRNLQPYLMLSGFVITLILLFKILWGFNYQLPHFKTFDSDLEKIDTSFLFSTFIDYTEKINTRAQTVDYPIDKKTLHRDIVSLLDDVHEPFEHFGIWRTNPKVLKPVLPGTFLHFNTAGMYFPFTGESLYDRGLHPLQLPPVVIHEWFHASGITDEGQCNFFAWLIGTYYIDDPYVNYTADLDLWFDLSRVVRKIHPELHKTELEKLSPVVKKHINEMRENGRQYSSAFDWVQNKIYNFYLNSQGISEGTLNYGKSLNYALNYLKRNENQ